jgi:phosphatidylinositol alpha-mannosyltransferase
LKIAQLCPYDIDRPGGVQRHILDLSGSLAAIGHDVTIIAPYVSQRVRKHGEAPVQHPVPIIHIGKGRLISINKTLLEISLAMGGEREKLDRLMRSSGFDIVHFHTPLNPFLPIQALGRSCAANVATFHAVPPETASGPVQRLLNRIFSQRIIAKLDGVILASEVQKDLHLSGTVLPPCTDLRRFYAGAPPFEGFGGDRINILFLGRLEPRKGAMVLLKAYAELCRQGLPVRLLIAGEGPERQILNRFAIERNIPDVVFLGQVEHGDVPRLYATCDVFCAPSLYAEGFGIILAEAMASGKPVVAAANAGYRTVLHGEAARSLALPGNVPDLCSKLAALIAQPALRESMGEWGRREAMRYDCERLAPAFLSIYDEAIRSKSRKTSRAMQVRS